jgi:tRNA(His) 5'-end guanylyltransferase
METEAGRNLKKLIETPVQLGWVNPRGYGKVKTVKTKTKDDLGTRMKGYESHQTTPRAMKRLPICVRVDGRAFHTFTRGLERPFDKGFAKAMVETCKFLVSQTHAKIGYTQSDEITLVFWDGSHKAEPLFGGKYFKLTSVIASLATGKFMSLIPEHMPSKVGKIPSWDARIFQVPDLSEAANLLLWRWIDARKNSISMAAQAYFSHKELHEKPSFERLTMLAGEGVLWDEYPEHLKWGTFIQRKVIERELNEAELDRIPEHVRHLHSGLKTRNDYVELALPLIEISNRVEVLFEGAEPELRIPE